MLKLIYGDGIRDNTAEFQAQINAIAAQISLGLGASAVLQLVGHTRVDWTQIVVPRFAGVSPRIEIDGTHEVLAGTLNVQGFELEGKAGGFSHVPGALSRIVGPPFDRSFTFERAASITERTNCGLFYGLLTEDQFNPDLTPIPSAVTYLNASIGLTMTASGASNPANNGSWTVIGWRFVTAAYPLNLEIRAVPVRAGSVSPDTLSASLNGRSNNGVLLKAVFDVFHVTGLSAAKLTNDFLSSYVGFEGAANSVFNLGDDASMARIVGVANRDLVTGKFFDCYAVNANATSSALTLPDANITAVVSSPLVRVTFGGTEIRNLVIQHWGIPVMIDNANGVKLRRIDCVPQLTAFPSTPMSVPCVVDTCFEVWFNDCNFLLNSDLSATQFAPAAVWLTVSQVTGFTGLVNFRRCTCNGSGFYLNSLLPLSPLALSLGLFSFDDIITESLRHPAIVLDSRQGIITNIKIKDFNLADTISVPSAIYAPTPQVYGSITDLEIGGKSYGFEISLVTTHQPIFNSNFGPIPGLFVHYDRPFKGGSYTLGTDNRYGILQRDGVLDVALEGARDSGGPSAPLDGTWLPIITNPNDPTTPWTGLLGENSGVALCTGFAPGPFGAPNKAGVIHVAAGSDSISLSKNFGFFPPPATVSVGDWFVVGFWAKAMDPTKAISASVSLFQVIPGVTIDHLPGNVPFVNDHAARTGGDWHLCVGAGKVTTVSGAGPFRFFFLIGASDPAASIDFGDTAYAYPFALWIPASKGYSDAEVARWVRHVRGVQHGVPFGTSAMYDDLKLGFGADTNLYRGAAGVVKTDGKLEATALLAQDAAANIAQVVGPQLPAITVDPTTIADAAARQAVTEILLALRSHGLVRETRFDAGSVAGLRAWYRADKGAVVDPATSNLLQWLDQSGNNHTLASPSSLNRPLWVENALNGGHPSVRFDGATSYMSNSDLVLAQPFTIWMVLKQIATTNDHIILDDRGDFAPTVNAVRIEQGGSGSDIFLTADQGVTKLTDPDLTVGSYGILRAIWDNATSSLQVGTHVAVTGAGGSGAGLTRGFAVGAFSFNMTLFASFELAEMIVYSGHQASGDTTTVRNGLAAEYGPLV